MDIMDFDGYEVVLADQCTIWRQMMYRRQTYMITKEKVDAAEEKRAQQQGEYSIWSTNYLILVMTCCWLMQSRIQW